MSDDGKFVERQQQRATPPDATWWEEAKRITAEVGNTVPAPIPAARQHITKAAWEKWRMKTVTSRAENEGWMRDSNTVVCTVEEWDALQAEYVCRNDMEVTYARADKLLRDCGKFVLGESRIGLLCDEVERLGAENQRLQAELAQANISIAYHAHMADHYAGILSRGDARTKPEPKPARFPALAEDQDPRFGRGNVAMED